MSDQPDSLPYVDFIRLEELEKKNKKRSKKRKAEKLSQIPVGANTRRDKSYSIDNVQNYDIETMEPEGLYILHFY